MSKYTVAVDIGTTTIRACSYDQNCKLLDVSTQQVEIIRTEQISEKSAEKELLVEIDPEKLFKQFVEVVMAVLRSVPSDGSVSMGICCQRNSFIIWDRKTQRTLSNFVVWSDTRARKRCSEWNRSWTLKGLNLVGGILYKVTRKPRFKAAQMLKFLSALVSHRLMVTIEKNAYAQELQKKGRLVYGCIDTWLLSKLSNGKVCVTEPSNTSSTGMYDPFQGDYNRTILRLIGFPIKLLNPIVDTASACPIVQVQPQIFGRPVNVHCMLADQQSALFGVGGCQKGDAKISLGTGTFIDVCTGDEAHASMSGRAVGNITRAYPLVGWCLNGRNTYVAEGNDHDTAVILNWARSINLFDDVTTTSEIAFSTTNPGVFFVPAFGGLQTPINDDNACCGFLGLRPHTSKEQMVRSILEAIAFRVYQIWTALDDEFQLKSSKIRICGGVAQNDFVCHCIASLLNKRIERVADGSLAASKGVALMTGMVQGWWSVADINQMIAVEKVFEPDAAERTTLLSTYTKWNKAVGRCSNFYE